MTQREAKEISLEVWRYLAAHPEIDRKKNLPNEIISKIKHCYNKCPLCDLFYYDFVCPDCPLETCYDGSLYDDWLWGSEAQRAIAALKIVEKIEAWEPEEGV